MYKLKYDLINPFKSRINYQILNKIIKISIKENIFYIFAFYDSKLPKNEISLGNFYKKYELINNNYIIKIEEDKLQIASIVYLNKEPTNNFISNIKLIKILKINLKINEIEIINSNIKEEHFKINEKTIFKKEEEKINIIKYFGYKKEIKEITNHILINKYKNYLKKADIKPIKIFNIFSKERKSGKKTFLKEISKKINFNLEKFDEKLINLNNFIFFCNELELKINDFNKKLKLFKNNETNSVLFILSENLLINNFIEYNFQLFPPNFEIRSEFLKFIFKSLNIFLNDFDILNQSLGGKSFFEIKNIIRNALTNKLFEEDITNKLNCLSINDNNNIKDTYNISPIILSIKDFNLPNKVYNCKFKDIGGYNKAKDSLIESVIYPFKYKLLYSKLNIQQTKGILLYGPPGCCKTMLARALAFESNLPFFHIKGPELKKGIVGDSERSIRELFLNARASSPCIIFFDEIDSISSNNGTNYELSLLTALLVELDGIDKLNDVFIIGATNRKDSIDPALLRPGRLDKHILIDLPNKKEREDIFKIYLDETYTYFLEKYSELSEGFSGAEIECLIKESKQILLNEIIKSGNNINLTNEMIEEGIKRIKKRKNLKSYK